MKLLLDTHTFLWWITDSPRLSDQARKLMSDGRNELFWSSASSWEVSIKYALGRLPLPKPPEHFLPPQLDQNHIESLPVIDAHAFLAGQLPPHHRDPFDRMLIAQARYESMALISDDMQFGPYDVEVLW
jgi:PIN domain nuclease of toxin-antitoxin system